MTVAQDDTLREIMRALGRLEAGQERQREDFESEKVASRESRLMTNSKLDKIEEDVSIVGKVSAQARQEAADAHQRAAELAKILDDDVKPVTDEIKRIKMRGIGALWAVGVLATAFGFSLANLGEGAINAMRAWLRIS